MAATPESRSENNLDGKTSRKAEKNSVTAALLCQL